MKLPDINYGAGSTPTLVPEFTAGQAVAVAQSSASIGSELFGQVSNVAKQVAMDDARSSSESKLYSMNDDLSKLQYDLQQKYSNDSSLSWSDYQNELSEQAKQIADSYYESSSNLEKSMMRDKRENMLSGIRQAAMNTVLSETPKRVASNLLNIQQKSAGIISRNPELFDLQYESISGIIDSQSLVGAEFKAEYKTKVGTELSTSALYGYMAKGDYDGGIAALNSGKFDVLGDGVAQWLDRLNDAKKTSKSVSYSNLFDQVRNVNNQAATTGNTSMLDQPLKVLSAIESDPSSTQDQRNQATILKRDVEATKAYAPQIQAIVSGSVYQADAALKQLDAAAADPKNAVYFDSINKVKARGQSLRDQRENIKSGEWLYQYDPDVQSKSDALMNMMISKQKGIASTIDVAVAAQGLAETIMQRSGDLGYASGQTGLLNPAFKPLVEELQNEIYQGVSVSRNSEEAMVALGQFNSMFGKYAPRLLGELANDKEYLTLASAMDIADISPVFAADIIRGEGMKLPEPANQELLGSEVSKFVSELELDDNHAKLVGRALRNAYIVNNQRETSPPSEKAIGELYRAMFPPQVQVGGNKTMSYAFKDDGGNLVVRSADDFKAQWDGLTLDTLKRTGQSMFYTSNKKPLSDDEFESLKDHAVLVPIGNGKYKVSAKNTFVMQSPDNKDIKRTAPYLAKKIGPDGKEAYETYVLDFTKLPIVRTPSVVEQIMQNTLYGLGQPLSSE